MADVFSSGFGQYDETSPFKLERLAAPSLGEAATASIGMVFDRGLGRWLERSDVQYGEMIARSKGTLQVYADEQEYKNSDARARIYAENYDKRREPGREPGLSARERDPAGTHGAGTGDGIRPGGNAGRQAD
jgi:hypothetical protein